MTHEEQVRRLYSMDSMGRAAIEWLRERGGDGAVTKQGRVLAHGDLSPARNSIWRWLAANSKVEYYGGARSQSRLRLKEDK
jgi:hypothetical protein